ncbi:MAG: nucleotidyltransferase family protein [Aphanothece sp. CMT-3BRIN-NPC111]|jgi:hypothetical protein|nr:nucleotidyltransferase family protein [Aphanothece sp. CMT-3BRIN-NPC111]
MNQENILSAEQKLLLQAAMQQGEAAIASWQAWKTVVNLDDIDSASYQLLPLVYRNLAGLYFQDNLMPKLKGIYRLRWCKNQLIFQSLIELLPVLQKAGIEFILLKDTALLFQAYQDLGKRTINTLAILVRPETVPETSNILLQLGWNATEIIFPKNLHCRTLSQFNKKSSIPLELHWYLTGTKVDEIFINTTSIFLQDISAPVLTANEQLTQLCLQETPLDIVSSIIWLADILMLLNLCPEFDWREIIVKAQKSGLVTQLKEKQPLLSEILDLKVSILTEIQSLQLSQLELLECQIQSFKREAAWEIFITRYAQYLRLAYNKGENFSLVGFVKHLQLLWELEHLWQVPVKAVSWITKKLFFT